LEGRALRAPCSQTRDPRSATRGGVKTSRSSALQSGGLRRTRPGEWATGTRRPTTGSPVLAAWSLSTRAWMCSWSPFRTPLRCRSESSSSPTFCKASKTSKNISSTRRPIEAEGQRRWLASSRKRTIPAQRRLDNQGLIDGPTINRTKRWPPAPAGILARIVRRTPSSARISSTRVPRLHTGASMVLAHSI